MNLTNLTLQIAAIGTISVGVVLVLLLGEIDLSVGAVSGLAAGVMAVLTVKHGWSPELAISPGRNRCTDRTLQRSHGDLLPDSVVRGDAGRTARRAGGPAVRVLGDTGTINLPPSTITDLAGTFYGAGVGGDLTASIVDGGHAGAQACWSAVVVRRRASKPIRSPGSSSAR